MYKKQIIYSNTLFTKYCLHLMHRLRQFTNTLLINYCLSYAQIKIIYFESF